jgi:2-isopropylmalate synthase
VDYANLVHNWASPVDVPACSFVDETIRDGLQIPFAPPLSVAQRSACVAFMQRVGIGDFIAGMHSRSVPAHNDEVTRIVDSAGAANAARQGTSPFPWILLRAELDDVDDFIERYGERPDSVGANFFICASRIRMWAEDWRLESQIERLRCCLDRIAGRFVRVRVALEDATRTDPATIVAVLDALKSYRIERLVIADTAGVATPESVAQLVPFFAAHLDGFASMPMLEWHGHNDRGLAVANSLQAWRSGCRFLHGTMMGIGERNGNAALEQLLVNVGIDFADIADWSALAEYHAFVKPLFGDLVAESAPFFGAYSLATSTGTHAAAMLKASRKGEDELSKLLFSPRSPISIARPVRYLVSPNTGRLGAAAALQSLGLPQNDAAIERVLALARQHRRTLHPQEIVDTVAGVPIPFSSEGV